MWNALLTVLITSVVSLVLLFMLCKLMGNKQISQLSMFDYIIGISIGSIAANLATELENPALPMLAMVVYALIAVSISLISAKSVAFRKVVKGCPTLLMDSGILYRENMRTARFDVMDFLTLCRISGYFDIADLQTAILEENGTVSFLPKADARPLEPRDVQQYPDQERVCYNVILDGKPLLRTLHALGRDETWLYERMLEYGYRNCSDIYLATLDAKDTLKIYPMTQEKKHFTPFD